jgi:hypothetical protein
MVDVNMRECVPLPGDYLDQIRRHDERHPHDVAIVVGPHRPPRVASALQDLGLPGEAPRPTLVATEARAEGSQPAAEAPEPEDVALVSVDRAVIVGGTIRRGEIAAFLAATFPVVLARWPAARIHLLVHINGGIAVGVNVPCPPPPPHDYERLADGIRNGFNRRP